MPTLRVNCMFMSLKLTISILEDDSHHVSLSDGVFVHQPQRLHLGVHKPAFFCTVKQKTFIMSTGSQSETSNQRVQNVLHSASYQSDGDILLIELLIFVLIH